jgi:hypothetical protein
VVRVVAGLVVASLIAGIAAVIAGRAGTPQGEHFGPSNPTVSSDLLGKPAATVQDAPATATFKFESRASGYQSSFYVLGFVTNTSAFAIDKPKVTAVLHDQSKKEIGTRDGYAEAETLEPNATAPIKLLVSDPPPFRDLSFEVVAVKASYHTASASGLTLEVLQPPHQVLGSWEVSGKVHNGGGQAARFVNVRALAFDAAGHLVGLDTTYADGQSLAAGADARFRITPLYDAPPHHFQYSVYAQLAAP